MPILVSQVLVLNPGFPASLSCPGASCKPIEYVPTILNPPGYSLLNIEKEVWQVRISPYEKCSDLKKIMGKIDAHCLRIKMMASYLVTNRCTKAFIFDEIQNLNFPPKTNKPISMTSKHFFFNFIKYWSSGLVVKILACHLGDRGSIPLGVNFFSQFFLQFFLWIKNQIHSAFWWYKPRSVEGIRIYSYFVSYLLNLIQSALQIYSM